MATLLTTIAKEKSTYMITIACTDEDGAAVAPATLTWSLSKSDGTAINSKTDVAISSPTSSETVVLSGDDLQIYASDDYIRVFVVEGTYNSDLGSGLPLKGSAKFQIEDIAAVT